MALTPMANSLQQAVSPAILTGDVSRAFLTIKKSIKVALSELEFYYEKPNGSPSFVESDSLTGKPVPFVRNRASYGSSDLPVLFHFVIQNCADIFRKAYPEPHAKENQSSNCSGIIFITHIVNR